MAKVRDVLGHVSVETAKGKRVCHRNRRSHSILQGEVCLVIRDPASGGSKNYCAPCAAAIVERAAAQLRGLQQALGLLSEHAKEEA
ncbi:MAG: hypothetical protein H6716_27800 [Polyangiaceae bacterium]|nr:hypothetical protein [Polyangiaceae bacterium]